jgi:2',3'-cyclic-nucleotide 2'-phosphodiesterase / 3'-nucleotidase
MPVTLPIPSSAHGCLGEYQFRILATTDLHAHVLPYDYTFDQPLSSTGLARTATLIRSARAEVRNSILVDNGDFLQGSPLGELIAQDGFLANGDPHPIITAMHAVGYDAGTIGNHDFSFGLPYLRASLAQANFPFVCANAVVRKAANMARDRHLIAPSTILERKLISDTGQEAILKIGVIGFLPPQLEVWENSHISGQVFTRDIVKAAQTWVPRLRADGADIVVALCHSGFDQTAHGDGLENAAVPLARVEGIDAIISGHIHLAFPDGGPNQWPHVDRVLGTICGKPAVMAGFWGSHLGLIDLDLTLGQDGWRIRDFRSSTRAISCRDANGKLRALVRSDRAVSRVVRGAHNATLAHVRKLVGKSDAPMHSYFARIADSAALQLVHDAQRSWLIDAVRDSPYEGMPVLSAASPFKSGGRGGPENFTDVPAGDIALRHIADIYVFPNTICAVEVTGAVIAKWLERSAAQFHQLSPGTAGQPLIKAEAPSYNFDTIAGVCYQIDLEAAPRYDVDGALLNPSAQRIHGLTHAGKPLDPKARFLVATNNFRAYGGGGFPGLDGNSVILEPQTLNAEVIRHYVTRMQQLSPRPARNWRLMAPTAGTGAWFDTGPRATAHMAEAHGLDITPQGLTRQGFLRCQLRF